MKNKHIGEKMNSFDNRTWLEIDLSNYKHNIRELKKFYPANCGFMQIVKADAYGHGALQIAQKAIEEKAEFLGVANLNEGIYLRKNHIKIPILILSPSFYFEIDDILHYNLIPSISDYEFAQKFSQKLKKQKYPIHINIDTGMGRSGFHYSQALENVEKIAKLDNLQIEGIFSHLACAEEKDNFYNQEQENKLKIIIEKIKNPLKYVHIANSAGCINLKGNFTNLVRIGLMSFGIYACKEFENILNLKPVMQVKTRIVQIKKANIGDCIGYNCTYKAKQNMQYALLPIGYADGYNYLLANKGFVLVNDKICPVIGKVSMDLTAIDISFANAKIGDVVSILGDKIRIENLVKEYDGSFYEFACHIGKRATKYFFDEGKIISTYSPLNRTIVNK